MNSLKPFSAIAALALAALVLSTAVPTQAFSPVPDQGKPATAQAVKWWQSDEYKKELGLTTEQTRRIEETFQKALPKLKVQKTALDEAEAKFERLVERGDDSTVMEQVNVVEAARAELNKTRTLMLLDMRKVLTRDQWAKFTAMHQATERPPAPAGSAAPAQSPGAK
jgi:Spy/CpxP family protein refolding chaperone